MSVIELSKVAPDDVSVPGDAIRNHEPPTVAVPTPHRDHVRSPVDVLRLIVAAGVLAAGVVAANLFDSTFLGLNEDGMRALDALPLWVAHLPATVLAATVLGGGIGAVLWALATRRYRRFALLTVAVGGAALLSVGVGRVIFSFIDPSVRAAFTGGAEVLAYRELGGAPRPGDPLLASAVALVGMSTSWFRRSLTRRLAIGVGLYALLSALTAGVPALSLAADIGIGLLVASALLLAFGRHDLAPDRTEILDALDSVGIQLISLDKLDVDARGSAPWMGRNRRGRPVFVKTLGRDERSADLMFRAYRWMRYRSTGDHRPFASLRRSVEHEALVSLQAAALGIPTPKIIGVAEAGVDGMVLAYEGIAGASADQLEDVALTDRALESIWTMVSSLHSRRIAHRDLRLANIFIAKDGQPMLIDFGFSELAASDQLLGTDVAELLASTAAVVGVERAVRAAHVATGLEELARALPWLQPSALSTATREAIGGRAGLAPIRTMLIEQCGIPAEEPVKLHRVDGRLLFVMATLALSAWFLIPQLADMETIWSQVQQASVFWAAVAVLFSLLTYTAATASLLGALPLAMPFGPALAAQLASSFANRVTPARVGGVATNVRWFQKRGVPPAVGVTAVGLNAVAGLITHITLTVLFLLLSGGDGGGGSLPIPSPATVGIAGAVAVGIVAVALVAEPTRRLLATHVLPQLLAGADSIRQVAKSPSRITLLFGGSAAITLFYLGAMVASLEAFGSDASFPLVGLLFLTGSAVANAAPTPGGLGAAEAALIGALSVAEEATVVIPAVFLYRFVTFWLPILPGWLALTYLRRTDQL